MYLKRSQDVQGMGNVVTDILFPAIAPVPWLISKAVGAADTPTTDSSGHVVAGPVTTFTGAVGKGIGTAFVVVAGLAAVYFIFLAETGRRNKKAIGAVAKAGLLL